MAFKLTQTNKQQTNKDHEWQIIENYDVLTWVWDRDRER